MAFDASTVITVQRFPAVMSGASGSSKDEIAEMADPDGLGGFDFLIGTWKSRQKRLKSVLSGSDDWEEFEGRQTVQKILGGRANMDEFTLHLPSGPRFGFTLRLYDPKTRVWSIYGLSSSDPTVMSVPTIGGFKNGRGEFFDYEVFQGRAIFVRFTWTHSGTESCHWEQAFSIDAGKTWEVNWIADFTRDSSRAAT